MFYPDLMTCTYNKVRNGFVQSALVTIGWLERDYHFSTGETPTAFAEKLLDLCDNSIYRIRSNYVCDLCTKLDSQAIVEAEIWVPGKENKIYVAPSLIYHYVTEHQYRPPDEFIEAVQLAQRGLSQQEAHELGPEEPHLLHNHFLRQYGPVSSEWKSMFGK